MPLNAAHILLTYRCTDACRHCFVYSGPHQLATYTVGRLKRAIDHVRQLRSVRWVYFEGGEPFLYFPMLLEAVAHATERDLATCIVTNGYWVTAEHDMGHYLRPLVAAGLKRIQFSIDTLHRYRRLDSLRSQIHDQCRKHRLSCQFLGVEEGDPNEEPLESRQGRTITGGEMAYRGRAADMLADVQASWLWSSFDLCPHERFADPLRVHIDPHGYVHACQGIIIGNVDSTPLDDIMAKHNPADHPILGPMIRGGPAAIVEEYELAHEEGYVDACHLCFRARQQLLGRYPDELGPPSVYGQREPRRPRIAPMPAPEEPADDADDTPIEDKDQPRSP